MPLRQSDPRVNADPLHETEEQLLQLFNDRLDPDQNVVQQQLSYEQKIAALEQYLFKLKQINDFLSKMKAELEQN